MGSYLDIFYNVTNDRNFSIPDDSVFNSRQNNFYIQANNAIKKLINEPYKEDLKQIKINTYYYKRYKSENELLHFVMFVFVVLICFALIKKRVPFIDDFAYFIIIGIILGLSFLYIIYKLWLLMNKDDFNYDEILFPSQKSSGGNGNDMDKSLNLNLCGVPEIDISGDEFDFSNILDF